MDRTFLLGVGAMKAGTTWLHDYLAASPQCQPGHRKEYHVFDSLDFRSEQGTEPWLLHRVVEKARASLDEVAAGRPTDPTYLHQAAMIADEQLYFDYFTALFSRSPDTRLTLDITPGYALLSAERLGSIRAEFERRGVRPVSVFLLRDPVERIWSQIRMQKRRRPANNPGSAEELVAQRYAEPSYAERTRYEATVGRLDEAFGGGGGVRVLRGAVRPRDRGLGNCSTVDASSASTTASPTSTRGSTCHRARPRCPRRRCARWPSTSGRPTSSCRPGSRTATCRRSGRAPASCSDPPGPPRAGPRPPCAGPARP